jgi:hypothetical protein
VTLVPVLFQKLVGMHGVDAVRLAREMHGKVKTRTWPGTAIDRHDLGSLPDAFPRFKGEVVAGVLRIETLRLTDGDTLTAMHRHTRLETALPALPDSVLAAMPGRRLAEIIGHPAVDAVTTVTGVDVRKAPDGSPRLVLELDMHRVPLSIIDLPRTIVPRHGPADLDELISRTHARATGIPVMTDGDLTDPRLWHGIVGRAWSMVGLSNEVSMAGGDPVVAVRFPYDRRLATALGRAGAGAWFDRTSYSWRVQPGPGQLDRLSDFLGRCADVVIGPDGHLHSPNQD